MNRYSSLTYNTLLYYSVHFAIIETLEKRDTLLASSNTYPQHTHAWTHTYTCKGKRQRNVQNITSLSKTSKTLLYYVGRCWAIKQLNNHKDSLWSMTVFIPPSWLCDMTLDTMQTDVQELWLLVYFLLPCIVHEWIYLSV